MALDEIVVDVTVSLGAPAVTVAGFGTPLIAGAATFSGQIQRYVESDDYANDTDLTSDIIAMITAMFAQDLHVRTVAVGKIEADVKQDVNILVNAVGGAGEIFGITINSSTFTHTSLVTDTPADVIDALKIAIDGGSEPVTTTDNGDNLDIEADVAGAPFTYSEPGTVTGDQTISETTANKSIKTQLDALKAVDNDWYVIVPESRAELQITRAIEWAQSDGSKLVVAQSSDADIPTSATDDLASLMQDNTYGRSILVYHPTDADKVASAWVGYALEANPDNDNIWWSHKPLTGIVPDGPSTTERAYLLDKNVNFFDTLGGVGITYDGKTSRGTWIDEQIIADWLAARVAEGLKDLLKDYSARNQKIPMTDAGYVVVGSVPWEWLNRGVVVGHFIGAEDGGTLTVTLPSNDPNSDNPISSTDRANRHVPITGSAELTGAVQTVVVNIDLVTG